MKTSMRSKIWWLFFFFLILFFVNLVFIIGFYSCSILKNRKKQYGNVYTNAEKKLYIQPEDFGYNDAIEGIDNNDGRLLREMTYMLDLTKKFDNGDTLLHIAARKDDVEYSVLAALCYCVNNRGWTVNIRNDEGLTAYDIVLDKFKNNSSVISKGVKKLLLLRPFNYKVLPVINRAVENFGGENLIVGSGWSLDYLYSTSCFLNAPYYVMVSNWNIYEATKNWYSVDISGRADPDLQGDFANKDHMKTLPDNHFNVVVFECIPNLVALKSSFYEILFRIMKSNGHALLRTRVTEELIEMIENSRFEDNFEIHYNKYIKDSISHVKIFKK